MVLFFAVCILLQMASGFAHPVTPTLFKTLKLGDYMFGYALAAMMTMNFLFSPFWGKLNGYLSSRAILLIGCFGYAGGQVLFTLAKTEIGILLARVFAGIFLSAIFVTILNYIINMAPDETQRGVWLTTSATIQSVAGAFGFFVGGMLGVLKTEYALIAQIIVLAVCGVLFFIVCENDAKIPLKELKVSKLAREANPFMAFVESRKFMTALLAILFIVCALHSLGSTVFDQSFNYYIKDQFDFSSAYNGILKAAMGLITLVANSTICVYLIKKTDVRKSIIGMLCLCTVTMLSIILMTKIVPFLVVNVFFYAFTAICLPLLQSIVADNARGENSTLVMGFYNAVKSLGGIFGALAAGSLYTYNPKYPFVCGMIAFGLAAGFALAFYTGSKKKEIE